MNALPYRTQRRGQKTRFKRWATASKLEVSFKITIAAYSDVSNHFEGSDFTEFREIPELLVVQTYVDANDLDPITFC